MLPGPTLQMAGLSWTNTPKTGALVTSKAVSSPISSEMVMKQEARLSALEAAVADIKANAITEDKMANILDMWTKRTQDAKVEAKAQAKAIQDAAKSTKSPAKLN